MASMGSGAFAILHPINQHRVMSNAYFFLFVFPMFFMFSHVFFHVFLCFSCFPMFSYVFLCFPMFSYVFICCLIFPMCFHIFSDVHVYFPMLSYFYMFPMFPIFPMPYIAQALSGGLCRGNISKQLRRSASQGMSLPSLYHVTVPIYNHKRKPLATREWSTLPVLLPHEFIAWLFDKHPSQFSLRFLGGRSQTSVASFWESFRHDDSLIWNHPALRQNTSLDKLCPLTSHSDGVPVTKQGAGAMSLYVFSVSSPLGIGTSLDTKVMCSAVPSTITYHPEPRVNATMEPILKAINWSITALNSGVHPDVDENGHKLDGKRAELAGTNIAGGWRFLNFQHRGDLEMNANELRLNHWSSNSPCFRCPCSRDTIFDFTNGPWKPSSWTNSAFKAPMGEFWATPGVCMRYVALDPAHMLDKGILQYVIGSVFKDMVFSKTLAPRGCKQTNLQVLWNLIQQFYERHGAHDALSKLDLKDFVNVQSPHTCHPDFKPGNMSKCRRLLPFAADLCDEFNSGNRYDAHRAAALRNLHDLYCVILHGDDFLSSTEVEKLQRCIDAFLAHQNWLHDFWAKKEIPMFKITVKSHYLWHMGRDAVYYNPRLGWTYSDEDFVGRIASVCRACTRSTTNSVRSDVLFKRYVLAISLRWNNQHEQA